MIRLQITEEGMRYEGKRERGKEGKRERGKEGKRKEGRGKREKGKRF